MTTGIFFLALSVSLISATVMITIKKLRLDELYQVHRFKFLPPEVCFFCLGFWLGVIQVGALYVFIPDIFYIVVPFIAAPLAKIFYEKGRSS